MHLINQIRRRGGQLAFVCILLLAGRTQASGESLVADFDGDGRGDRISLDARDPSIMRIWFSGTRITQIIRSTQPLRDIRAVDLNGDHHPELIASNRSHGLQVWVKAHAGFRHYRRKRPPSPHDLSHPNRRRVDDDAPPAAAAIGAAKDSPPSLAAVQHRQSVLSGIRHDLPGLTRPPRSALDAAPFAPRPPPGASI